MLDVGALYATHWEPICRFLRRTAPTLSVGDIEDVAALTFEKAARAAADNIYREQGTAVPWLYTIARNALTDHWREQQARPVCDEITSDAPGGRATVDAGSQVHLTQMEIAEALLRLPWRQRLALVEQHWMGASQEDTALLMGITPGSLRHLRMRARERLYRILTRVA